MGSENKTCFCFKMLCQKVRVLLAHHGTHFVARALSTVYILYVHQLDIAYKSPT